MNDLTIIYYTDNSLPFWFRNRVYLELVRAAKGKRIISVSQEPLPWDDNICLGNIGRSHHSLFTQVLAGAQKATTKFIALAEHDCMYTPEHFEWVPSDDNVFWYNINHWYVQLKTGEYSYHRRRPMSQLICSRELLIPAITEKIMMLETGFEIRKGQPGACEPGVCDNRTAFVRAKERWYQDVSMMGKDGMPVDEAFEASSFTPEMKEAKLAWWNKMKDVGKESKWFADAFRTKLPNLDIRHGENFSGNRRARQCTMDLAPWGNFLNYLYEDCCVASS